MKFKTKHSLHAQFTTETNAEFCPLFFSPVHVDNMSQYEIHRANQENQWVAQFQAEFNHWNDNVWLIYQCRDRPDQLDHQEFLDTMADRELRESPARLVNLWVQLIRFVLKLRFNHNNHVLKGPPGPPGPSGSPGPAGEAVSSSNVHMIKCKFYERLLLCNDRDRREIRARKATEVTRRHSVMINSQLELLRVHPARQVFIAKCY